MIFNLNPWQILLWIAGLEIVSAPIVIAMANGIFTGYFRAKEIHSGKVAKAIGNALQSMDLKDALSLLKKEEEKKNAEE